MKNLFFDERSWNYFLTEGISELERISEDPAKEELFFNNLGIINDPDTSLASRRLDPETAAEIPPLYKSRIVKRLGTGAYGTAFLLDNDHVLKIGVMSEKDINWYESISNRAFSGKSGKDEMMVYEYGDTSRRAASYVEMSRTIPFTDYSANKLGMDYDSEDGEVVSVFFLADIYRALFANGAPPKDSAFTEYLSVLTDERKLIEVAQLFDEFTYDYEFFANRREFLAVQKLPESFLRGFFIAMRNYTKRNGHIPEDIHAGNIGLLYQNPNVVVIFDA